MKIQQTSPAFGRMVRVNTTREKADKIETLMPDDNWHVERKTDHSKQVYIMPKKEYDNLDLLATDIASSIYPNKVLDDENRPRTSIGKTWAQDKVKETVLDDLMHNERKNAVDISV